jgi:hypothetical protein
MRGFDKGKCEANVDHDHCMYLAFDLDLSCLGLSDIIT